MLSADREPTMKVWDSTPKVHDGHSGQKKPCGVHLKLVSTNLKPHMCHLTFLFLLITSDDLQGHSRPFIDISCAWHFDLDRLTSKDYRWHEMR